jgi:hypothetical protein
MPERPLFPNGALARSDAMFRDPQGANAFREPAAATSAAATSAAATPAAATPAAATSADATPAAATPAAATSADATPAAATFTASYADLDTPRLAGEAGQAVPAAQSDPAARPIDSNIFASPQASGIRAFRSGDFETTQGDNSATLLLAGQIALALGVLGAVIFGTVLVELVYRPFLVFASGLFVVSGGVALTVLIRGWNDVSLQRLGVMRRSEGTVAKWAVGYAVLAGVLALAGLGGITIGWLW